MLFEGQVASTKSLNILYDDVERHYHVIAKFTAATARRYVCKWFNKSRRLDVTHACDQTCSDCMACPPPRANSRALESPVVNVIHIFEVVRATTNTSSAQ